jgi:AraC family transcriptional regulator, regulatory protein of adaptative response / DNA-3-methyladenine glycosylase II
MAQKPKTVSLDTKTFYPAFKAHDARFDGRIFVGVSSTKIYCRPVCSARIPKEENCTFFPSAAAAEAAGYRPCLKCRPELAPGFAPVDAAASLASKAACLMEEGLPCRSLEDMAKSLGVTGRHLRRVFLAEYGVSPVQYVQTNRLLMAKSLLTDTCLNATEIAFAAGFGSIRRFNALFLQHYRLSPSSFRKKTDRSREGGMDGITLFLGYRPPYLWDNILAFLNERAIPGVESVADHAYHRTAVIQSCGKTYRGIISVRNVEKKNVLAVTVCVALLPVLQAVLARVKHLFDLDCDPVEIASRLSVMNEIKEGLCVPGIRVPGCFDGFEMAVRAVLGQQITVKAARTLAGRIAGAYGAELKNPAHGLTRTFPTPADIYSLDEPIENHLGVLGVTGARARSIRVLAEGIESGDIKLSVSADPEMQMRKLLALPGFGPWTVQYIAMRALRSPDAFPYTDYGVKKALNGRAQKQILELSGQWEPWRSYATVLLWNSL